MRTAIILGSIFIAFAINPNILDIEYNQGINSLTIFIWLFFIMDVIELFKSKK